MKKMNVPSLMILAVIIFVLPRVLPNLGGGRQPNPTDVPANQQLVRGLVGNWPPVDLSGSTGLAEDMTAGNYMVIFDGSGSMEGSKLRDAKEAVSILTTEIPEADNLGLIVFSENGIRIVSELGRGQQNREAFSRDLQSVRAGGNTPLGQAIEVGIDRLEQQARRQSTSGSHYTLLIITDGEATDADALISTMNRMLPTTRPPVSPIVFQTIGFQIDERHILNQPGRTLYTSAQDGDALREAISNVVVEAQTFSPGDSTFGEN
jgi:uncharacterized protein YegL